VKFIIVAANEPTCPAGRQISLIFVLRFLSHNNQAL